MKLFLASLVLSAATCGALAQTSAIMIPAVSTSAATTAEQKARAAKNLAAMKAMVSGIRKSKLAASAKTAGTAVKTSKTVTTISKSAVRRK